MVLLVMVIAIAFIYAFINGFHDGGNVLATIVASRSMPPRKALFYACISEFAGPLLLGTGVAATMGTGIIRWDFVHTGSPEAALLFLLSAMAAAILWNLATWYFKLPSSSSHALVGGMLGAGITAYGLDSMNWDTFLFKVLLVLLLSPLVGLVFGNVILKWLSKCMYYCNPRINKYIKKVQLFSMILLGLSHSSNDSQKPMGLIIVALLVSGNIPEFKVPLWVQMGCAIAITAGLYLSGWRIVGTVGRKIFKVKPIHSLSAQFAAALTIIGSSLIGGTVSSTQVISSAIVGTGIAERKNAVNWGTVKNIVISWITTIPASAGIASVFYFLASKWI